MTEHDRILDAFRNCITEPKCKDCPWTECEELDNRKIKIPADLALAVMRELVAQEPRVMMLEELINMAGDHEIIWVEDNGSDDCIDGWAEPDENHESVILWQPGNEVEWEPNNAEYGKTWRCWTSRPTEEQRRNTPWE